MDTARQVEHWLQQGLDRARVDEWRSAADCFRRAVAAGRTGAEPRFRLGWALWKDAEARKPTLADLGVGYVAHLAGLEALSRPRAEKFTAHRKLLREASHWLREAIAREPGHARSHFYLALVLGELGYKADAADLAKRSAELEPANTQYAQLAASMTDSHDDAGPRDQTTPSGARLTWDDLVLPARTKQELRQIELMLSRPDLARELGIQPPTGVLLKGSPGTGKTTVARVLANEANTAFLAVSPADINQMFVGESEKRVRELFERARDQAPAIVFIDEIDALIPSRQGGIAIHSDKVVNQFLQEMDGMQPNRRVLVIGATNRPDMLDPAVRRGGRLSREIEIPLPDSAARAALLDLFSRPARLAAEVDLAQLVAMTEGYSGADLRAVVDDAGLQALIRIADADTEEPTREIISEDFLAALENLRVAAADR